MKTEVLVKAGDAQVQRVVSLAEGDVYKRLVKSDYAEPRLVFGVVTGVMDNGETTVVTTIEVDTEYGAAKVASRVFDGSKDLLLFPAEVVELARHRNEVLEAVHRAETNAEKALEDAQEKSRLVEAALARIDGKLRVLEGGQG